MMTPLRRRVSTSQHGGVNASGVYSAVRVRFAIYTVYESIHDCRMLNTSNVKNTKAVVTRTLTIAFRGLCLKNHRALRRPALHQ